MKKIHPKYRVHKFGGASLADADCFISIKSLIGNKHEVIVVSAIHACTSALQNLLDMAKNQEFYAESLSNLEKKHLALADVLLPGNKNEHITSSIQKDCSDIKEILQAVQLTGFYSKEIQDLILGYGEIWSAKILSDYLSLDSQVIYLEASWVLFIEQKNESIFIDWKRSQMALEKFLEGKSFDRIVITGFIASTREGRRTILGRNGGDFSAAIFANLFKAECVYIWKDVDGIFTADPKRVRSAFIIEALSYNEALELAYFGAKILHPMTIAPLLKHQIPLYIKNSLNPKAKGTYISAVSAASPELIKGLTCIDNVTLINIEGTGIIAVSGIAARVFQILHQMAISVILISQASSQHSICFAISSNHADLALVELRENLRFEMDRQELQSIHADKNCAILAVVGDNMVGAVGISGKLCATLAKANINIRAISQGSSERNISIVIKDKEMNRALQAVHAGFYLSPKTLSVGLIGPGQVGSVFLNQIHSALSSLQAKYQINLCVRGIMNSKSMFLSHESIDLAKWPELFTQRKTTANIEDFVKHIKADDVPHSVIIDCTANPDISAQYLNFFESGIHVITPNKHANAGKLSVYQKLKSLAQKKNLHYLYEATVCAGLPVINTLQDIIKTGDEVLKIEGVVSGTLSFIFNELAKGRLFSEIVMEAKMRGFTEPDPREDLSGQDVVRKLVCLAREIGHEVSVDDVQVHNLVPDALKQCSIEEFLNKLPDFDDQMAQFTKKANDRNERLCYAGIIYADGSLKVSIDSFTQEHPFSRLKGSDNMLVFHTRRYHEHPLIIQGPGAGAEVTASGIFADLLRLVSYLS